MNEQLCDQYIEWMSLAQDGMLSSTQTHLLHTHLAGCPPCRATWEAMTMVSQMLHATPMMAPMPGFVARVQTRLARRAEQHRQAAVGALLAVGALTLAILALPSIAGVLSLTGRVVLPYPAFAYLQGLSAWMTILFTSLAETVWVLLRHLAARPAALACAAFAAVVGAFIVIWMRLVLGRMATQKAR